MVWSALRFQVVFPSFPVLHIFVTHSEARGSEKQKHVAAAGVQSSLITCSNSWQITCEQEQLPCCRCLDAPACPRRCWSHVFSTTERNDFKQPRTPPVHVWAWVLDSDRCELFVFVLSVPQQTAGRLRRYCGFCTRVSLRCDCSQRGVCWQYVLIRSTMCPRSWIHLQFSLWLHKYPETLFKQVKRRQISPTGVFISQNPLQLNLRGFLFKPYSLGSRKAPRVSHKMNYVWISFICVGFSALVIVHAGSLLHCHVLLGLLNRRSQRW